MLRGYVLRCRLRSRGRRILLCAKALRLVPTEESETTMNIPQRARELALDLRQEWTSTKDIAAIEAFAAEVERDALERALNVVKVHRANWGLNPVGRGFGKVVDNVMAIETAIRALITIPRPERPETDDDTDTLINVVRQASRLIAMVDGILTGNRDTQMDELRSAIVSVSDKLHERYAGTLRPDPTENDPTVALAKLFARHWQQIPYVMLFPDFVDEHSEPTALGLEAVRIAKENECG